VSPGRRPDERPAVSVIVATRDRPDFLPDCLGSIAAELTDDDELIVAETGDSAVAAAAGALAHPIVHLHSRVGGKSRQLNEAVAEASNPILLFTDDDCRTSPGWVEGMAAPFSDDERTAIAFGPVVGLTHLPGEPVEGPPPGDAPFVTWTYAHGASLAVRRAACLSVGGFDVRLGPGAPAHGEEHDLLLRLREGGWRAVIADAPPVRHLDWRDDAQTLANLLVYERGSGAFLGAALRRAPRATLPLLDHRLSYQRALFTAGHQRDRAFGPRTLASFAGGLLYGVRLRPEAGPQRSQQSLWSISRSARASRPVFIIGEARSGTSLLYRLLQQHPSFAPATLNLVESDAVIRLATLSNLDDENTESLRNFLLWDEAAWKRFRRLVRPFDAVRPLTATLNRRLATRLPRVWWLTGGAVNLRAYFNVAREVRAVPRLVDKTPQNTPYAHHLLLAYPRSCMLYMSRHPVDVYSSYRRRSTVDLDATWTHLSVDEFISRYRSMAEAALRFAKRHPDAIMLVRYDDLTTNLEATFARICRFLDETPDREALTRDTSSEGGVPFDPHLFGAVVAKTKEWSDHLSAEEAAEIEARLAPVITALGYQQYGGTRDAASPELDR